MTKHFKKSEFACKCCGQTKYSLSLNTVLELVRLKFGKPVYITSSYRCAKHNKAVGGAEKSQHLHGTAADIYIEGVEPKDIYSFVDEIYPNSLGLGLYSSFVHIDVRGNKARWQS